MNIEYSWLILGLLGQAIFSARFVVQWLASEREKKSVIPVAFWYLSIVGGLVLFVYSLHTRDPVFILGQSTGVFIYLRNLSFVLRERKLETATNL
ncbi:MAG: lipid-A-disaccharide synthase N-terminal domain-containing protein [Legionella sp.]|nr:lipid-A-disaccharide synthase N-terminal domain-containing protein [Legionella sp.]